MSDDARQAFARKWPTWRICMVVAFFAFTVWAMETHRPTQWFVIPATIALHECWRDWRGRRDRRDA